MMVEEFGIEVDCSIFLKGTSYIEPHSVCYSTNGPELVRVPHMFQDNMYLMKEWDWSSGALEIDRPGWKIFNFHPVHIVLNSRTPEAYARLRASNPIPEVQARDVEPVMQEGAGSFTLFEDVVSHLGKIGSTRISNLAAEWRKDQ